MPGELYLCATPIGNLEDMTYRAVRVLTEADLILAEDTRRTRTLLDHYGITTATVSYHRHNQHRRHPQIKEWLQGGRCLALVSDAGTPTLSDPGEELVRLVREWGFGVRVLPGPSAVTAALAWSGLPAGRFCFEGFIPRGEEERRRWLEGLAGEERTLVCLEVPHRLRDTLEEVSRVWGDRELALSREISKVHEEILVGSANQLLQQLPERIRGEITLVFAGYKAEPPDIETAAVMVEEAIKQGYSLRDAVRRVAEDTGVSRRELYRCCLDARTRAPNSRCQ